MSTRSSPGRRSRSSRPSTTAIATPRSSSSPRTRCRTRARSARASALRIPDRATSRRRATASTRSRSRSSATRKRAAFLAESNGLALDATPDRRHRARRFRSSCSTCRQGGEPLATIAPAYYNDKQAHRHAARVTTSSTTTRSTRASRSWCRSRRCTLVEAPPRSTPTGAAPRQAAAAARDAATAVQRARTTRGTPASFAACSTCSPSPRSTSTTSTRRSPSRSASCSARPTSRSAMTRRPRTRSSTCSAASPSTRSPRSPTRRRSARCGSKAGGKVECVRLASPSHAAGRPRRAARARSGRARSVADAREPVGAAPTLPRSPMARLAGFSLAGHTATGTDATVGVIADAGGASPATLAALGRLRGKLDAGPRRCRDLARRHGRDAGRARGVARRARDRRELAVVAIPGDLEPARRTTPRSPRCARRAPRSSTAARAHWIELTGATIAHAPGRRRPGTPRRRRRRLRFAARRPRHARDDARRQARHPRDRAFEAPRAPRTASRPATSRPPAPYRRPRPGRAASPPRRHPEGATAPRSCCHPAPSDAATRLSGPAHTRPRESSRSTTVDGRGGRWPIVTRRCYHRASCPPRRPHIS